MYKILYIFTCVIDAQAYTCSKYTLYIYTIQASYTNILHFSYKSFLKNKVPQKKKKNNNNHDTKKFLFSAYIVALNSYVFRLHIILFL